MIYEEDIIKIRVSQKDAYRKNTHHENTHHTRHGGRTDHSTSSHGLVPSSTDRVMEILQTWVFVIMGYVRIWSRDTWEFIKEIRKLVR